MAAIQRQHDSSARQTPPRFGPAPEARRTLILVLWAILICCVVIGSMSPAGSAVVAAVARLRINDKVMHFCAYLTLSLLPVVGFRDRRRGLAAGLSMFALGVLMEAGQHFSPGRAVEFGDVIANGLGVTCGVLFAFPIRATSVGRYRSVVGFCKTLEIASGTS